MQYFGGWDIHEVNEKWNKTNTNDGRKDTVMITEQCILYKIA